MKTISGTFKGSPKIYTFNTELDVKEGQELETNEYKTIIIVVNPNLGNYSYVNIKTGELTNEFLRDCVSLKVLTLK